MIGLGLMGSALSARLIDAGLPVIGFDIDAARCQALRVGGGQAAASASELIAQCRTIVVALYDAAQIGKVFDRCDNCAFLSDATMICITTCAPAEIVGLAKRATSAGLRFVEAPISGTSAEVRDGKAMALISGEPEAIEGASALLDVLCPQRIRVGNIGDAARTKLALNLILQTNRTALAEGIAFAESLGLDAADFLTTARRSAAYSHVMDVKGEKMLARDFTPQSHISQTLKDAELILGEARRLGQTLPMMTVQGALLRATIALMGGECDSAAVIETIRPSRKRSGGRK
jgi:3-hydroxyisobutyrate dehydrogenase-like beta-hydroxyacid dehydrogenase